MYATIGEIHKLTSNNAKGVSHGVCLWVKGNLWDLLIVQEKHTTWEVNFSYFNKVCTSLLNTPIEGCALLVMPHMCFVVIKA